MLLQRDSFSFVFAVLVVSVENIDKDGVLSLARDDKLFAVVHDFVLGLGFISGSNPLSPVSPDVFSIFSADARVTCELGSGKFKSSSSSSESLTDFRIVDGLNSRSPNLLFVSVALTLDRLLLFRLDFGLATTGFPKTSFILSTTSSSR
jgi:hypothetical protein